MKTLDAGGSFTLDHESGEILPTAEVSLEAPVKPTVEPEALASPVTAVDAA